MPTLPPLLNLRLPHSRHLAALALLFTFLNAVKPLQIDDSAYYCYARQIAADPLHPYGFDMFWYEWPHPANEILAPPVLPYWWAIALHLFGDHVFLCKMWLLPFSLLFVWSLTALLRRFARGLETPLLWMIVLSPAFLPSLNLMLDVPELALALSAIVVFMRAAARDSLGLAVLAGILAGLATQTKYTGLLAPGVIVLYGLLFRRSLLGLSAAVMALFLFVSWELFIIQQHGQSHFLYHVRDNDSVIESAHPTSNFLKGVWVRIENKAHNLLPLLTILGGLGPPLVLLNFAGLGARRRFVALLGAFLAFGYALIALFEASFTIEVSGTRLLTDSGRAMASGKLSLESILFSAYGLLLLGSALSVLWFLCVRDGLEEIEDPVGFDWLWSPFRRLDYFLILWLGLEVLGYLALTPFPAVRRVLGIVVVGTLLAGRLAARTCASPERRNLISWIAAAGVALGLVIYGVDVNDAYAEKRAAEDAAAYVRACAPEATIWYVGHWGFQHYAERAGMVPVVPGGITRVRGSMLRKGDWLVKPDWRLNQQMIKIDPWATHFVTTLRIEDRLPLRTVVCYYGGHTPLEHHEGPRVELAIYRITDDWVPDPDW